MEPLLFSYCPGGADRPQSPYTGAVFQLRSCNVSWSRRFEETIELPDGRKLKTLAEAMAWLAKEIPKSEHKMEKVQAAAYCDAGGGAWRADDLRPDGNDAGDPPAS